MSRRSLAVLLILIAVACRQTASRRREPEPAANGKGGPQTSATVVTIDTHLEPAHRNLQHTLILAGDRARSNDEIDRWRLFDLGQSSVTVVDDVARTYYSLPSATLLERRRKLLASSVPEGMPRASVSGGASKTLHGVSAAQTLITLGSYRREIWIGQHPKIPAQLFPMMLASEPRSEQLAGVAGRAEAALLDSKGFPLADHSELAYGNGPPLVADRTVTSIQQKNVSASLLQVPSSYKQIAPPAVAAPLGARAALQRGGKAVPVNVALPPVASPAPQAPATPAAPMATTSAAPETTSSPTTGTAPATSSTAPETKSPALTPTKTQPTKTPPGPASVKATGKPGKPVGKPKPAAKRVVKKSSLPAKVKAPASVKKPAVKPAVKPPVPKPPVTKKAGAKPAAKTPPKPPAKKVVPPKKPASESSPGTL